MRIDRIILFLMIFNFSAIHNSLGEPKKLNISPFTPEAITEELNKNGNAKEILKYILNDNTKAEIFLNGIEGGEEKWLNLYPIFRSFTDATITISLEMSLAYSIKNNPKLGLEMLYKGGGKARRICGHIKEEWTEEEFTENLIRSALQEINFRTKALNSLSDNFLYQNILNECKEILLENNDYWENELMRISKTK